MIESILDIYNVWVVSSLFFNLTLLVVASVIFWKLYRFAQSEALTTFTLLTFSVWEDLVLTELLFFIYQSLPGIAKHMWHIAYFLTAVLFVWIVWSLHQVSDIAYSRLAKLATTIYIIFMFAQLIRYFDRYLIKSDLLANQFSIVMAGLSTFMAISLCMNAVILLTKSIKLTEAQKV